MKDWKDKEIFEAEDPDLEVLVWEIAATDTKTCFFRSYRDALDYIKDLVNELTEENELGIELHLIKMQLSKYLLKCQGT